MQYFKEFVGPIIGVIFCAAAQRSQFCLRASAVEFAHGHIGPCTAVWLLTFATALFWTQFAINFEYVDLTEARILAVPGLISSAVLGVFLGAFLAALATRELKLQGSEGGASMQRTCLARRLWTLVACWRGAVPLAMALPALRYPRS